MGTVRAQDTVPVGKGKVVGREGSHACPQKQDTALGASPGKVTTENLEAVVVGNDSGSWHLLPPSWIPFGPLC